MVALPWCWWLQLISMVVTKRRGTCGNFLKGNKMKSILSTDLFRAQKVLLYNAVFVFLDFFQNWGQMSQNPMLLHQSFT